MINLLSIDWDYFINTSNETRNTCFPNIPDDILTEEQRKEIWEPLYEEYDIENIGILEDEFDQLKDILQRILYNNKNIIKYVNDSHRYMYDLVYQSLKAAKTRFVRVFNIDFHHDMYQYRKPNEKVNCGNWAEILQEELSEKFDYNWIKREDSEEFSLLGQVEYNESSLEDLPKVNFDGIYLCKSGAWSPPHLDDAFIELKNCIYSN
jgi:hypothetical protein